MRFSYFQNNGGYNKLDIIASSTDNTGHHGGSVAYEYYFSDDKPSVVIKDSKNKTYSVDKNKSVIDADWTSGEEANKNHVSFVLADGENKIISNSKTNYVYTTGYPNATKLDYTYNGGNDTVSTTSHADDVYNVDTFNKDTRLEITDDGGIDTINFTNTQTDNIRLFFDVQVVREWSEETDKWEYSFRYSPTSALVHNSAFNTASMKNYLAGNKSAGIIDIFFESPETESGAVNNGIETITTSDGTINFNNWKNSIAIRIYEWMSKQTNIDLYTMPSLSGLIADGVLTAKQISELQELFNVKYTDIGEGEFIVGNSGNDSLVGGPGDDVIYANRGNDTVRGGLGADTINTGAGQNTIIYNLGDGDDVILNGEGVDTLAFEEGTELSLTYSGNDLVIIYKGLVNDEEVSNTITVKNYKTDENPSVKYVKVGDSEALDVADFITIGTTEFFNYNGDVWPILQRGVYGTDSGETLNGTPTGIYKNSQREGEWYYTYGGDDKVVLRLTSNIGELTNVVAFKPGDDNDTIMNTQRVKEGAAEYSDEQAIYQEETWSKPNQSNTSLDFKGVTTEDLDIQVVDGDIVINYTDGDSVTIKDGYYSTNVGSIRTYELDPNYKQARTRLWYGNGEPGSEEWIATRDVRETTDYGYGTQGLLYSNTVKLRDLISDKNIDNSQAATAQTTEGWIWKDSITASSHGDAIKGYSGNDTLTGGIGDDNIDGGGDNDVINGGAGNDTILGGLGRDTISGGNGNDVINGLRDLRADEVEIDLSGYADDDDIIDGGAGNDMIYGGLGRDTISGGTGNDTIIGSNYDNGNTVYLYSTINGGDDNDSITGAGVIHGDSGNDTISGNGKLYGDEGDDVITLINTSYDMQYYNQLKNPDIDGGEGNDTIILSNPNNEYAPYESIYISGGAGDDKIVRGTSVNLDNLNIDAGEGNDHVYINMDGYSSKNATIDGGAGNDTTEFQSSLWTNSLNDVTVMKDSSGEDDKLLILGTNMSYYKYDNYLYCPVAFFDLELNKDGSIKLIGNDVYLNSTMYSQGSAANLSQFGNKSASVKLEGILADEADSFENVYIKNMQNTPLGLQNTTLEHGYRRLNVENLKNKYIEYMTEHGLTNLANAIANNTHKAALAQISMSDDVWEYSLYRPYYTDENGVAHSNFDSDDEGVYGDNTDRILTSHFNYDSTNNVSHNELIVGGSGNETINSLSKGNDYIDGGAGNDIINANEGNDTIIGGLGNDSLTGGDGVNTFIFNAGDGNDIITDAKQDDIIQIDSVTNFEITKNNQNKLQIAYDGGVIVIDSYNFDSADNIDVLKIKKLDGTYQTFSIKDEFFNTVNGTNASEVLNGSANNDIITGYKGNDTINAGLGKNSIRYVLGDGNDIIANGGGVDTLVFEDGTTVTTSRSNNDLKVTYSGIVGNETVSNTITVINYYSTQNHSVQFIKIGDTTYPVNNFYSLSRGDEKLEDLTVTAGNPVILTLTNPFGSSNYQYVIATNETSEQTFDVEFLLNGRLEISGNNLNITANSNQKDDIIILGDGNNVVTADKDDIVRVGGAMDSAGFYQSNNNTVDTGLGNDHVTYCGVNDSIDTGDGTDSVLSIASSPTNIVENAEYNRTYNVNEPASSVNGVISTFTQGNVGECRILSIIESLSQKGLFANAVSITDNGDNYTVTFNNYNKAGKLKSVQIAKTELNGFTNAYGDLDVVLTDLALNKLLKLNGDSIYAPRKTYAETATYNTLGEYVYGQNLVTVALYDPSQAGLSYNYRTRVEQLWSLYQSGTIKNLTVGFLCEDNYNLGIISNHAYTIKNIVTGENGYITLVNPWNNKDVLNLDLTTFFGLEANVYSYGVDYYNEHFIIDNVPQPITREGTDGDDTFTSTADNEIFNLKKGDDTVSFGNDFGDDVIISKYGYNGLQGHENFTTLNMPNYSISDGTLSVSIDGDGDTYNMLLSAASTDGEHGGTITVNNFASNNEVADVVIKDKDTTWYAWGYAAFEGDFPQNNNSLDTGSTSIPQKGYNNIFVIKNDRDDKLYGNFNFDSDSSVERKNVIVTGGNIDLTYYHDSNVADDRVYTLEGNDIYQINQLTNDTKLKITDLGGNDTLGFETNLLEKIRILFNVKADGSYDNVNMKAVHTDMITSANFKSVYNSTDKGIIISAEAGADGTGEGIERVVAQGHTVQNVTEWKDAIAGAVSTWLRKPANNFTSVEDALARGTAAQITELYNLFDVDYASNLNSTVISSTNCKQVIAGKIWGDGNNLLGTDISEFLLGTTVTDEITFDAVYTGKGNDTVQITQNRTIWYNGNLDSTDTYAYFKKGDGNDTIINTETIARGDELFSYSTAQTDLQERINNNYDPLAQGLTRLNFVGIDANNLTARKDGNDIVVQYSANDSVRIENGYYATNVRELWTWEAVSGSGRTYLYGDGPLNNWYQTSEQKSYTATGYSVGYDPISQLTLKDILELDAIDNSTASTAQIAQGWIWNDNIIASNFGDTIYGENGDDTIVGGNDADTIYGGYGSDNITGGDGNDLIYGDIPVDSGEYRKFIVGDTIDGGNGDDTIYGASTYSGGGVYYWADSNISGGAGNDKITGAGTLDGGDGNDFIKVNNRQDSSTPNLITGGEGNDTIVLHGTRGIGGTFLGGDGNDTLLTSTSRYDYEEGNEIERIDLRNDSYQPIVYGSVDMGAGHDHVRIAAAADLIIDGGVDDDVIEVAAPKYISDFKTIVIKNSGGHDAVNLVSTRNTFNFNYHGEPLWDSDEQAYVVKKTYAPVAFFDMQKVGNNWTYGDDIYICTTAPNRYVEESVLTYIGDKENSIKFENGLVAGHDFDIYIKNDESVGPFDYGSTFQYKGGYRLLDVDKLKQKYAAKLTELGYTSLSAALNETNADKQAANRATLATVATAEDVWVYTLDRPTEFSLGNFYDGDGSAQYYKDFASGTGAENNLVTNFMIGQVQHPLNEYFGGTDAKEFIYSTLNGDDIVRAGGGDDVIYAGRGNDQIWAGEGNNRIVFAKSYYLYGNQIDHYNSPPYGQWYTINENTESNTTDGHDTVYNDGGIDTLDFMENDVVKFDKNGRDLVISYAFEKVEDEDVTSASVTVKDYFLANGDIDANHSAKYIKFKTRGVVALADEYNARENAAYVFGTAANDSLSGVYVFSGSGNDTLTAQGYGYDAYYLDGSDGNDVYGVFATSDKATVISDSGNTSSGYSSERNSIYLEDTNNTEFRGFYDVSATKDGDTVTTKLGDNLHIFNVGTGYKPQGGVIVSLGYQNLLDEDFDTSGYDKNVVINNNKEYKTSYTIYSHEENGHYYTNYISEIIEQSESWLTANYDAVAGVLGDGVEVSTINLMASNAEGAAALQSSLLNQINTNIYWS